MVLAVFGRFSPIGYQLHQPAVLTAHVVAHSAHVKLPLMQLHGRGHSR